jgi:ABC-type uncharacterized transport system involved in gliding motility auxiliary subunit
MRIKTQTLALILLALGVASLLVAAGSAFVTFEFSNVVKIALALGVTLLGLAGYFGLANLRSAASGRASRYWLEVVLVSLIVLTICGAINYALLDSRLSFTHDFTRDKVNTLSEQTIEMLSKISEPITVYDFQDPNNSSDANRKLVTRYNDASNGNLIYTPIDPNIRPDLAEKYAVEAYGTVVLVMGERFEKLNFANEQNLSNGVYKLLNPTQYKLYFVTGHQERGIDDTAQNGMSGMVSGLNSLNFQTETVSLLTQDVPADASALIIAGPQLPYSADEIAKIEAFQARGGAVLAFLEPSLLTQIDPADDLLAQYFANHWGISARNDIVVDFQQMIDSPLFPAVQSYPDSPITADLNGLVSVYPNARSLALSTSGELGFSPTAVVESGAGAWGETDFTSIEAQSPQPDGDDASGPLALGAQAENPATGARVIVFGDIDFFSNLMAQNPQLSLGSRLLFQNLVKWSLGDEAGLQINPNTAGQNNSNIVTDADQRMVWTLGLFIPLLVVIVMATMTFLSRRRNG